MYLKNVSILNKYMYKRGHVFFEKFIDLKLAVHTPIHILWKTNSSPIDSKKTKNIN